MEQSSACAPEPGAGPVVPEKKNLFSVHYAITDYEKASDLIVDRAAKRQSFGVSALAVHGLVESVWDVRLGAQVNRIDLVVPDGMPVRWALDHFYKTRLPDRVYGPTLTKYVLQKADQRGLSVFLYGSRAATLEKFQVWIQKSYPRLRIVGVHVDRFRDATPQEDAQDVERINASGAHLVLVGRGCPRQERWVADHQGRVHAAMMAVGAAFDFHAGTQRQAPAWMQRRGLEWLFRLWQEPGRLWKRYLFTNSYFVYLCLKHKVCGMPSR